MTDADTSAEAAQMTEGRCLCGAVRLRAALGDEISACFCSLCARWAGGVQMGIEASTDSVRVSGPVRTFRSSPFAERAWCETCGSALWLRDDDGPYEFVPGLFADAGGARLVRVVYADCAPGGFDVTGPGDVHRVSKAAYERERPHV